MDYLQTRRNGCVSWPAYLLPLLVCCPACSYTGPSSEPDPPAARGDAAEPPSGGAAVSGSDAESASDAFGGENREDSAAGSDVESTGAVDRGGNATVVLLTPPLVFATTDSGFGVNVVVSAGEPERLGLDLREASDPRWTPASASREIGAAEVVQWRVGLLRPATAYRYRVVERVPDATDAVLYQGSVTTRRNPGDSFVFCMLADTHVFVHDPGITGDIVNRVARQIENEAPDLVIHLGDMLDYHYFGFNQPPPDPGWVRIGYLAYRVLAGDLPGRVTHYAVIGNWDGENGDFTPEEIERSRSQRLLYLPGPTQGTYAEGGSPSGDYFAFTWGDALFVVLNVMSYTPQGHYLSGDTGAADDWTLGEEQLFWLEQTLKNSGSRWKLLFIHHVVGGKAGDAANSAYGRGGGQAALVGEQAVVHGLMQQYGVQALFYGHDHVFFDMVVDGIHYSLPGSAGAPWKFHSAETGYPAGEYWTDSGYARARVRPDRIEVEFVNTNDQIVYGYTIE